MTPEMRAASLLALAGLVLRSRGEHAQLVEECEQQAKRLLPTEPALRIPETPRTGLNVPVAGIEVPEFTRAGSLD